VGGNQIMGVRMDVGSGPEVRVDNENNESKSIFETCLNIVQGGGLYIRVREHSH